MNELKTSFKNYFNFRGGASKKEFTTFFLLDFAVIVILKILDRVEYNHVGLAYFHIFLALFAIVLVIPFLSVSVRRLHDIGESGWWVLVYLIPVAHLILAIYLMSKQSKDNSSSYSSCAENRQQSSKNKSTSSDYDRKDYNPVITDSFKQKLIDIYATGYEQTQNLSSREARKIATDLFEAAKEEAIKAGTYNLPRSLGDLIVDDVVPSDSKAREIFDKTKKRMPRLKNELVNDKDIVWWWNLTEVERIMMAKNDETVHFAFFLDKLEEIASNFKSVEEASPIARGMVNKTFAIYGYDESPTYSQDDPLPFELRDRVDAYMEKLASNGGLFKLRSETQKFSTFNAFVRSEIKKGNL